MEPAGPQHPRPWQGKGRPFPGGLAGPVHAQRLHGLLGPPGGTLPTAEDEIGADLQQPATGLRQGGGEGGGACGVDRHRQLRFGLRPVHRCIGGSIEHPVGVVALNGAATGLSVREVELVAGAGDQLDPVRHGTAEDPTQLT